MDIKQAVQASANVIRITSISAGDVYKRFQEHSYSDNECKIGIVQNVHNNGELAIIEAIEYSIKWSGIDADYKIIKSGDKDALFPCSPEELAKFSNDAIKRIQDDIKIKEENLSNAKKTLEATKQLLDPKYIGKLKQMSYKELSQSEYNSKKLEAGL